MHIKKRNFASYVFLNCITLGIYGLIESVAIGKEINTLCKDDGEEPKLTYIGAVIIRAIAPFIGLIWGLIAGLSSAGSFYWNVRSSIYWYLEDGYRAIVVLSAMIVYGAIFTVIGSLISGIYLNYWWYKQSNRLKLNANRYGLDVKESGTDTFLFRTIINVFLLPITIMLLVLSFFVPGIIVWLITLGDSIGAAIAALIFALIFLIPLLLFSAELTTGANFSMYFVFKNLNRYSEVCGNGAEPFDPMRYEYYPSLESKYPNYLPGLIAEKPEPIESIEPGRTRFPQAMGSLVGLTGSCAGYQFDLNAGEEIVIGKDAQYANVVIDETYKEISRKHVGITYDITTDMYKVIDYSTNGTWANGTRLPINVESYCGHGTILKLANDKNTFRLG